MLNALPAIIRAGAVQPEALLFQPVDRMQACFQARVAGLVDFNSAVC
jgi:hypothetical protein